MQDFRKLTVWQKAHDLVLSIYELTAEFPKEELFGLRLQLRKSAIDLTGYIAEGCGKSSDEEFAKCIRTALGLANRLEYFALVANDLNLLDLAKYELLNNRTVELAKMLNSFRQKLTGRGQHSFDN